MHCIGASLALVRIGGLEPPLREELDPKSSAATNYAISAWWKSGCKGTILFYYGGLCFLVC